MRKKRKNKTNEKRIITEQTLFWALVVAWTAFFLLVTFGSYFLLPLVGVTSLMPIAASIFTVSSHIAVGIILNIGGCLVAGALLATGAFHKPFAMNLVTNFNIYRWRQLLRQIVTNAYKNGDSQKNFSSWQLFNLMAHLYLVVGGLQLITNKVFHQLYSVEINHKDLTPKKSTSTRTALLLAPRILLAIPFVLVLLPLNVLGTAIEQANYALYRACWSVADSEGYSQAKKLGIAKTNSQTKAASRVYKTWGKGLSRPATTEIKEWSRGQGPTLFIKRENPITQAQQAAAKQNLSVKVNEEGVLEIRAPRPGAALQFAE